jgi:hypothetical protein
MRLIRSSGWLGIVLVAAALAASVASAARPPGAQPTAGAFFLNTTTSTTGPSLRIDASGSMHVVAVARQTGILSTYDPRLPAYYFSCAAGSDCSQWANWTQVALGEKVQIAQLDLTPEGHPRLLLQTAEQPPAGTGNASFWYAECDLDCTEPANWSMIDLADTGIIDTTYWERPNHSFALDPQGRPRFLFGEGSVVYASCDSSCTETAIDPESGASVAVNWSGTVLARGLYGTQRALAFTSTGQPRIGALMYDPDTSLFTVDYLECHAACDDAAQWSQLTLRPRGKAPESVSLRVDGEDGVGIALAQSGSAVYYHCAATCSDLDSWRWTGWRGLTPVQDADLAFDQQNRPHLALRSSGGNAGWGLWHVWCVNDCTSNGAWSGSIVEDADALPRALPLLPPNNCRISGWMGDFRPSLAIDPTGAANFIFDNEFWVTCSDYTSTRTMFAGVRLLLPEQAAGATRALGRSDAVLGPAEYGRAMP